MFTENIVADINKSEIDRKRKTLRSLVDDKELDRSDAKKRCLIGAFEWFCTVKFPKLITKFPKCLFCLLEYDIVPNYIFVRWFEDESLRNDYSMQASLISEKHLQYLKEVSVELKFIDYVRDDIKFAEEFDEDEDD